MADDKNEQIKLVVFIKRRGGTVTVREVTQCYWPLKNQRVKAEAMLNELVTIGRAEWKNVEPTTRGGRPTRKIRLLPVKHSKGALYDNNNYDNDNGKRGKLIRNQAELDALLGGRVLSAGRVAAIKAGLI